LNTKTLFFQREKHQISCLRSHNERYPIKILEEHPLAFESLVSSIDLFSFFSC